jgi:uncharacterized RDD family membrane protein YckC
MNAGSQRPATGIAVAQQPAGPVSTTASPADRAALAGWWPRAGALLIDGLIVAVVTAPVSLTTSLMVSSIIGVVVTGLYAGVLMARRGDRNGQTLGKQLVGLRVVADDGPVSFARAFVRDGLFKGLLSIFTLLLDYLWALWDAERQTLHDKAVATYVVRTSPGRALTEPPPAAAVPAVSLPFAQPPPPSDRTPNWLDDPRREARLRYWDGTQWTAHTAP